jgi:Flp pilus assembly protein TadG
MPAMKMSDNSRKNWRGLLRSAAKGVLREEGASIVEMAFACVVLLSMFFGIFSMSFALYTYHYISNAAREGSRYAMVRGSTSCANSSSKLTNCGATSAQIQTYVQDLGYPGIDAANKMTVSSTWFKAVSSGTPATTTWSACTTGTCNAPGNIVKVQVTYAFPLGIPYYGRRTLNMTSASQMVIAQ